MSRTLTIGQLAKLTGVSPKTIRYYEDAGVLPPPQRSESRYRLYWESDVRRLELIRRARVLDMTLHEVRELVEWASNETCNDFQDRFQEVVRRKLEEVDRRTADLQSLKDDLTHLAAHLAVNPKEDAHAEHAMLACSPETCSCLGNADWTNSQERR